MSPAQVPGIIMYDRLSIIIYAHVAYYTTIQ